MHTRRSVFLSLAVHDLNKSSKFFASLGFDFDPALGNDNGRCLVLNEHTRVMLLDKTFFRVCTDKSLCDTRSRTETIVTLTCASRAEVDATVALALAAGGRRAMAPLDHGAWYSSSFYDLDEHHWELVHMGRAPATA